jgi:hypothetical protein
MKKRYIFLTTMLILLVMGVFIYFWQLEDYINIPFLQEYIGSGENVFPNGSLASNGSSVAGGEASGEVEAALEAVSTGGSGIESGGRGAFLAEESPSGWSRCEEFTNCTEESDSVCGWFDPNQLSCTDGPCVRRFVNVCEACADSRVLYWTNGECPFYG